MIKALVHVQLRRRSFYAISSDRVLSYFDQYGRESGDDTLSHLYSSECVIHPYWIDQLKKVYKPTARSLISQLTTSNPLGYQQLNSGKSSSKTLLDYVQKQKLLHESKIILVRCGEFYETYGVDAVMMVAYAGLNPMGDKCKAGCPVQNIQQTLDHLTDAGLSVAVYEELEDLDLAKSAERKLKSRALTQVISPASRTYMYGLTMKDGDVDYRHNRPVVGIRHSGEGYTLCELYTDERKMTVMERLTAEAVQSILQTTGYTEPVYFQGHSIKNLPFLNEASIETLTHYSEGAFADQVQLRTRALFEIETEGIKVCRKDFFSMARPVYSSTALQIGLQPNHNVPSLVKALLPRSHDQFSYGFWSRWLLNPPPHTVADHMRSLCSKLLTHPSLPGFTPVSVGKVVSFLSANAANVGLFQDIRRNVNSVRRMLTDGELRLLAEPLLALTAYQSDIPANQATLIAGCSRVLASIEAVVALPGSTDDCCSDASKLVPDDFFRRNEAQFRGKVLSTHPSLCLLYQDIRVAARDVCAAVESSSASGHCVLVHDILNNSLVLKVKDKSIKAKNNKAQHNQQNEVGAELVAFVDRKGKTVPERFTTSPIRVAVARYLELTEQATLGVSTILKELCAKLRTDLVAIQQSSHWAVICRAACDHTSSARQKGWSLPTMTDVANCSTKSETSKAAAAAGIHAEMRVVGMSPYWIDRSAAVLNDVQLRGVFLLTAPNMSGKSTLMRSLLVSALLANCGMFVPCTSAVVPRYDTFFLRTASYDVPSEGKSAFALEMDDVRVVLRDCTHKSLVMIDELGKGTSARDGSALAGALLEELDRRSVSGVFATHLHELFQLPLELHAVQNKRMGIAHETGNGWRWTYKLQDGTCTDSMALLTAQRYRIDPRIVSRAEELAREFDKKCRAHARPSRDGAFDSSSELEPAQLVGDVSSPHLRYDLRRDVGNLLQSYSADSSQQPELVEQDWQPPPKLEGTSCVYVLHISGGSKECMYVGETESLAQRLKQHRDAYRREGCTVRCMAIPVESKSRARQLEPLLIRQLKERGVLLYRSGDANHSLFGGAAQT